MQDRSAFQRVAEVLARHRSNTVLLCPEGCGGQLRLRRHGGQFFWGCERYPLCKATHPADPQTGDPIGVPVSRQLRALRQVVEQEIAGYAIDAQVSRWEAVARIAAVTALQFRSVDLGQLSERECQQVRRVIHQLLAEVSGAGRRSRRGSRPKTVAASGGDLSGWESVGPVRRRVIVEE